MPDSDKPLDGARVLAALNGLELFGHERGNIEVFKTLRDQGAEVLVGVNSKPDNQVKEELGRLGFATLALPFGIQWSIQWVRKHPTVVGSNFLAVLRCSRIFHAAVRRFRATHVHLGSSLTYSYLSLALALSRVPLIYRMGDHPPDSLFNRQIWRVAMLRSTLLISNSESVRLSVKRECSKETTVIHSVARVSCSDQLSGGSSTSERSETNLVYVGQVSEHKGLVPLVEAFAELVVDDPTLRLDIVGGSRYDAPFRARLERLVAARRLESRVTLHGQVADPTAFYRRAAIHVAPSIWEEPLANVVLEAKCCGTPSVVFPSGGLPELVRHQVDGYICREKSLDALLEGLRWMLAEPARLRHMGERAREDSDARFGPQRFARAWADVYRSVG